MNIIKAKQILDQVPPGVFAEEMEDLDLFQNCAEKAGF